MLRSAVFSVLGLLCADSVLAQERFRISANAGQQTSTATLTQQQTFDRYFEQGSFTFERTIPKAIIYDLGASVRIWRGLHVGAAASLFDNTGPGTVTARVPHPLQFNKPRTSSGDITNTMRRELGQHLMFGWNISTVATPRFGRAPRGLDFTLFAGPSIFVAEQLFVTSLTLSLENEVFPFDELAFPAAQTTSVRDTVLGYNAGVDMTWRFNNKVGVGVLLRYSNGTKAFAPAAGSQPVDVTVGGLHAGGGLRLMFGTPRRTVPPPKQPPVKQPPAKQPPAKQPPAKQPPTGK
jgi:hypothetical protein